MINSVFKDSLFKMSLTKKIHLNLCHIYIIKTNTDSQPKWHDIALLLPGNNLENMLSYIIILTGDDDWVLVVLLTVRV